MTFLVVVFIFLMQFVWKYIDDMVGKGIEWGILMKLMGYTAITFIPMSLPLALLLSGLMTFGNMGERYELVAMKSSGIPLYRIMRPLICFALACSVGSFFLANNLVPYANLKSGILLRDVRSQKPAFNIDEKVFYKGIDNYVIRVGEKEKDNQTVHDILIYDHSKGTTYATLTRAERGSMVMDEARQELVFTLYNGFVYDENIRETNCSPEELSIMRGKFNSQQIRFDLSSFQFSHSTEEMFSNNYTVLNIMQLDKYIDSIRTELKTGKADMGPNLLLGFKSIGRHCLDSNLQKTETDTLATELPWNSQKRFAQATVALQLAREHRSAIDFFRMDCEGQTSQLWRYEIEWHRKFTLCAACIILFFIGAPLGSIIRKGGIGIPLTISILIFVIYWVISTIGERMARIGSISSAMGMWISSLVLLPVGIFLIYKSTKESQWLEFFSFKKLKNLISARLKKKHEDTPIV